MTDSTLIVPTEGLSLVPCEQNVSHNHDKPVAQEAEPPLAKPDWLARS